LAVPLATANDPEENAIGNRFSFYSPLAANLFVKLMSMLDMGFI